MEALYFGDWNNSNNNITEVIQPKIQVTIEDKIKQDCKLCFFFVFLGDLCTHRGTVKEPGLYWVCPV